MANIVAHADGQLEFDRVIEAICQCNPGAGVTDSDYYATRMARELAISRELGMPIPNAPLECTARVSKEHGVQREVLVPIRAGLSLCGRLDRLGCLFVTEKDATDAPTIDDVRPLIDILTGAGLRIELDGFAESG